MKEKVKKWVRDKRFETGMKIGVLVLSCLVIWGCFQKNTFAWFTAQSEQVVNTFTIGDINISLQETDAKKDETDGIYKKAYSFVPGRTLEKDPSVTVTAGSEKCYLFIRVEEENNTHADLEGSIIAWEVRTGDWSPVIGADQKPIGGYWYRIIEQNDEDPLTEDKQGKKLYILKNNKVTVNKGVTKEMVDTINTNKPSLTFKAAAVQYEGMANVLEAWKSLPDDFKN